MNNINFNDLPTDIKKLIFDKNRETALKEKKLLEDFWLEWGNDYWEELEEAWEEGKVSSCDWDELTKQEKKDLYEFHNKRMRIHYDLMECGWSDELL